MKICYFRALGLNSVVVLSFSLAIAVYYFFLFGLLFFPPLRQSGENFVITILHMVEDVSGKPGFPRSNSTPFHVFLKPNS